MLRGKKKKDESLKHINWSLSPWLYITRLFIYTSVMVHVLSDQKIINFYGTN